MPEKDMEKLIEQKYELLMQILAIDKEIYTAKEKQRVLRKKMHEIEAKIVLLAFSEEAKETTA